MRKLIAFLTVLILLIPQTSVYAGTSERIPVLLYHHILPASVFVGDNAFVITAEEFRNQMKYLYDNGYNTITEDDMYAFLFENKPLPAKSVMIHFDDGYYSNVKYAYPILKEYGFKATVFLITVLINDLEEAPNNCSFIDKKSMEETFDVFTYASHTHDMHKSENGKTILTSSSKEAMVKDLRQSFEVAHNSFSFAYPHGQYNENIIDAAKEAGISLAYSIRPGYVMRSSNPFALNRFTIYRDTGLAQFERLVSLKHT